MRSFGRGNIGKTRSQYKKAAQRQALRLSQESQTSSIYGTAQRDFRRLSQQVSQTGASSSDDAWQLSQQTSVSSSSSSSSSGENVSSSSDEEVSDERIPPPEDNLSYFTTRLGLEMPPNSAGTLRKKLLRQVKGCRASLEAEQITFDGKRISLQELTPLPTFQDSMKIKSDYGLRRFELGACTMHSKCCEICHAYWVLAL